MGTQSQSLRELRDSLGRVVRQVSEEGDPVIITDHGKQLAAIIPMSQLHRLQQDPEAVARRVAFVHRIASESGTPITPEGVAAMGDRLRDFQERRRLADAA